MQTEEAILTVVSGFPGGHLFHLSYMLKEEFQLF